MKSNFLFIIIIIIAINLLLLNISVLSSSPPSLSFRPSRRLPVACGTGYVNIQAKNIKIAENTSTPYAKDYFATLSPPNENADKASDGKISTKYLNLPCVCTIMSSAVSAPRNDLYARRSSADGGYTRGPSTRL